MFDNVVQLCVFYGIYQCNNDIIFSNFLKICQSSIISQMIAKISFCTILQKILFAPMIYPLIKSPFVLLSNFLPGNLISAKKVGKRALSNLLLDQLQHDNFSMYFELLIDFWQFTKWNQMMKTACKCPSKTQKID